MNLLLFSNSTNAGEDYLEFTLPLVKAFTKGKTINAVFFPYAGVTINWDEYSELVANKLLQTGIVVNPIHQSKDPINEINQAEMIIVGGGNTFNLLKTLQEKRLLDAIRNKVKNNTPYISWSAGSNLACPTIKTTNDMPIVEPQSFDALNVIPFQINPHYTDTRIENHAGETREMRLNEFLIANQNIYVAGLREGTMLHIEKNSVSLHGNKSCRVLHHGQEPKELKKESDFSFLMQ